MLHTGGELYITIAMCGDRSSRSGLAFPWSDILSHIWLVVYGKRSATSAAIVNGITTATNPVPRSSTLIPLVGQVGFEPTT